MGTQAICIYQNNMISQSSN